MIVEATNDVADLALYKRRTRWHGEAGADGAGGRKTGRAGADVTLRVPAGTIALDSDGSLLADLALPGADAVIARGGAGGRGNVHFKSSRRRAPDYAEPGLSGEEREVTLDLKLIADVGLVGPPNAGKSSLLRAMTAARPKVADYPFTTLDPELGVADAGASRMILADIPGLIEGAAKGAGLGQRFLRHVERTKALVYVLDGSQPDVWKQLDTVRREVAEFSSGLAERPHLIAVNKVDLPEARRLRSRNRRAGVHFASALTGEGMPELTAAIFALVASAPRPGVPAAATVTRLSERKRDAVVVERNASGFAVRAERLERLVARTDLDSEGALARFQSELDRLGVNAALEAAGVKPGDMVTISGVEFEYRP